MLTVVLGKHVLTVVLGKPCLDSCDAPTCLSSSTDQLESQTCSPLLVNEIFGSVHDDEWWLIDSGAGVTVLSERSANFFGIDLERLSGAQVDQGFSAANGSAVRMLEEVTVDVAVLLEDAQGTQSWQSASMNAWIGDTQHNILSTTVLNNVRSQTGPIKPHTVHLLIPKLRPCDNLTQGNCHRCI